MKKSTLSRAILMICMILMAIVTMSCSKSPEQVREWMKDKRAPVKMKEFIQSPRNPIESKVEAVMVLTERGNCVELPEALGSPLKPAELNDIVAGSIKRMTDLVKEKPEYETKVKDAAYYLLKFDLNDENRNALIEIIRHWLDSDNFFQPAAKAGRVEQNKLYELLGSDSLPIFQKAIDRKLVEFEEALVNEAAKEKELLAQGKKYKVISRPSEQITSMLSSTLTNLESLKIPGADDLVAKLFLKRIEEQYPNMQRTYVLPFASNHSELLRPMAKKIILDPEYHNPTLNYYKDVLIAKYYRNVQKKDGIEVCSELVKNDRTGYLRWDCLELLTAAKGREGFITLIQSLPKSYEEIAIPKDHPTFIETPSMTLWNSMRVYCTHLPAALNNQIPLDIFRQLVPKGNIVTRILSMACLQTLGETDDAKLLATYSKEKTSIKNWEMNVNTVGDLATFTSLMLVKRLDMIKENERIAAEKAKEKAEKEAAKKAAQDAKKAAQNGEKPAESADKAAETNDKAAEIADKPAESADKAAE